MPARGVRSTAKSELGLGLAVGFGLGWIAASRTHQRHTTDLAPMSGRRATPWVTAAGKARAVVDLGRERLRSMGSPLDRPEHSMSIPTISVVRPYDPASPSLN